PTTALGTAFFAGVPAEWLGRFAGVFLISSVPLRRLLATDFVRMRLRYFPALGAFIGLLSAMVVTTGPLNTPFFLSYGLRRSAFVGTEAVCSMAMHLARGATRSEEHTSELQSRSDLVCRLLLEKKNNIIDLDTQLLAAHAAAP